MGHHVTPKPALSLTRRGRLLLLLVVAVVALAAFSLGRVSSSAAEPGASVSLPRVTVQANETLWQLAVRVAPHNDPRDVVDQLVRLNHLGGAGLRAGQSLVVPRA